MKKIRDIVHDRDRIYSILLACMVITLVWWPLGNSVACILLAVYWLWKGEKRFQRSWQGSLYALLFMGLYAWVLVGALYSEDHREVMQRLQQKLPFVLFPLVFGFSTDFSDRLRRRTLEVFVWAMLSGSLWCVSRGLSYLLIDGSWDHLHGYGLVGLKDAYPFNLGLFSLFAMVIVWNECRSTWGHLPVWLALIWFSLFVLMLGNRMSTIGLFLLAFCLLVQVAGNWRRRMVLLGGMMAVCLGIIAMVPSAKKQWLEVVRVQQGDEIPLDRDASLGRDWGGFALRKAIWRCAWDLIREHPMTGVGSGDSQVELQKVYESRKFYFASRYNHYNAHNQYLQETISYGIPGLLLLLSILFIPWYRTRHLKSYRTLHGLLLLISLALMTESMFELNKGVVFVGFFIPLLFVRIRGFGDSGIG